MASHPCASPHCTAPCIALLVPQVQGDGCLQFSLPCPLPFLPVLPPYRTALLYCLPPLLVPQVQGDGGLHPAALRRSYLPCSNYLPPPWSVLPAHRFKEMEAYILQRRDELTGGGGKSGSSKAEAAAAPAAPKGFA